MVDAIDGDWRLVYASVPKTTHTASGSLMAAVGGGGSTTVSITPGFHTATTTLAAEIQTRLQSVDANFACSFDSTAGMLSITHSRTFFTSTSSVKIGSSKRS